MVRGFDISEGDTTKWFLEYLFGYFGEKNPLRADEAHKHILNWLQTNTSTSNIYKNLHGVASPSILLKQKCPSSQFQFLPRQNDKVFPASQQGDNIIICLQHIRNKVQLKQNLDRELSILQSNTKIPETANHEEKERQLMKNLYIGCMEGYKNYNFPPQLTERMGKKCATYLFRRRSNSKLPHDSLFRYVQKMADEVCL